MKRTFIINGQSFTTVGCANTARKMYNKKNPNNKLKSAKDAVQFVEVR